MRGGERAEPPEASLPTAPSVSDGAVRHGRSDLPARLATAAVGIPALLALIVTGGKPYTVAVAVMLALGAGELYRAAGMRATDPLALWGMAGAAAMAPAAHLHADVRLAVLTALVLGTLAIVVARAEVVAGFARWTAAVAGAVYVGVLGSHLVLLRQLDDGQDWILLMLFTTFATDTGAYVAGRALGRRKLAPRVSPGKTIAGAVGGLLAGAITAVALNAVLGLDRTLPGMATLGVAAAVAAQLGDLAESLLKRALGVKDMGRLFPGHGGVLDRMDSILFVTPVVYYGARWILQ